MPPVRTYVSGWSSRIDRSSAVHRSTIHDIGAGSAHNAAYNAANDDNSYESITARCLESGTYWEDPDFPPVQESLFFKTPPSAWPNVEWKRPREICSDPQLFVGGASQMDVVQGCLGDCWLLAAIACLSTNEKMMSEVIPAGQSFDEDTYTGVFRFNFWQYGRWVEVMVDDRLPTTYDRLIYMHSEERNEFWTALIEKAYAKLCGSYEALCGGLTSEALTDFTGGIVERFELGDKAPSNLWRLMLKAYNKGSLMGCSIDISPGGQMEGRLENGLIEGHAYSITKVKAVQVETSRVSGKIILVRIRNPWGDSHEWNGAWSDSSEEWNAVPEEEREELGLSFDHDGEFWMSYRDFVALYRRLEICSLGPDSMTHIEEPNPFNSTLFEGGWKRRVNAGGCRNNHATFWTNPQYHIKVVDPDPDDEDGTATVIIGLMQKDRRKMRCEGHMELTIGYAVYKAPPDVSGNLDANFFRRHSSSARSPAFINLREVCETHQLEPGDYVIVPSTYAPNEDGDFILRVFSESENNVTDVSEMDEQTGRGEIHEEELDNGKSDSDDSNEEEGMQSFISIAGEDGEIDATELRNVLNAIFMKEFEFSGFSNDLSRSMVAMCDLDYTGKLGFEDFKKLLKDLKICTRAFRMMDTDRNGFFNSYELRLALSALGMTVSNATYNAIVMRFSDKDGHIQFDEFVSIYIKLKSTFETFKRVDEDECGTAKFGLDVFTLLTMYS